MKSYPTIPYWNRGLFGEQCYAFEKLDGSNIRAEWNLKKGWYKYGSKKQLIDEENEFLGHAVLLFQLKYGDALEKVFRDKYRECHNFVVFAEYFGDNSFAGWHDEADEKDVVLFDVNQYKRGLIEPKEFIKNFQHLHIPDLIYSGNYNKELVQQIKEGDLREGVVCKGVRKRLIWMTKIKSNKWLDKLHNLKGELELLKELNGDKELLAEIKS